METTIHTRDIRLSARLEEYVMKKTARLDRTMPSASELRIDLSTQNARNTQERQIAQMTLRDGSGAILRAEERHGDIFAAIDEVTDKLYRQIKRFQGKRKRKRRQAPSLAYVGAALAIDDELDALDVAEEETTIITRTKRFAIQPMSAEEAADQMELLGHDFYMYYDPDESAVNVVYRRRDRTFGVLQPVVS